MVYGMFDLECENEAPAQVLNGREHACAVTEW